MGYQRVVWRGQLPHQHAMRHVVGLPFHFQPPKNSLTYNPSHASIDAATRAARGLPEDLIRLCVGIEDPMDLLEDLEHALLEAGAIIQTTAVGGSQYVRPTISPVKPPVQQGHRKTPSVSSVLGLVRSRRPANREWLVSAPGKVILFGEHAVVHGVVSLVLISPLNI